MTIDGSRVKARRRAMKFSQADVAVRSGLGQSSVSKIEKGEIDGRVRETQDRLARALLTSADYLCGLTDEPGPVPAFIPAMRDGKLVGEDAQPARAIEDDETPLEQALFDVMDTSRFASKDFDLARRVVREVHRRVADDQDLRAIALDILTACKAERATNSDADVKDAALRWALGKQTPAQRAASDARAAETTAAAVKRAEALGYGKPGDVPSPFAPTKKGGGGT